MVPHILLLDGKNRPFLHGTNYGPENTHSGPAVQRKIFDTHQGAVEVGSLLQTLQDDLVALLEATKLLATVPMAVGPAFGLARRRTIPRKPACLALEQDGKVGLLGSFAAAVTKVSTDGVKERHITIRSSVEYR